VTTIAPSSGGKGVCIVTREEILKTYTVLNGRITSPGKFEHEPIYAPYFYEDSMNGFWHEDRNGSYWTEVTVLDRQMFPEIPARKRTIHVSEDEMGFVHIY
jgi:hypothetical protein